MEKKSPQVIAPLKRQAQNIKLTDEHVCYVLITCRKPSKNGDMEVEMTYEGDKILASYLIETAQGVLDK